eukprot:GHVS01033432.1.p1 GENE.GHVS01033432.1~~GHVS01033432.1.p1  ORF type:complete len:337 (-),score=14.38 GHVS01033432.1:37-1047(-)
MYFHHTHADWAQAPAPSKHKTSPPAFSSLLICLGLTLGSALLANAGLPHEVLPDEAKVGKVLPNMTIGSKVAGTSLHVVWKDGTRNNYQSRSASYVDTVDLMALKKEAVSARFYLGSYVGSHGEVLPDVCTVEFVASALPVELIADLPQLLIEARRIAQDRNFPEACYSPNITFLRLGALAVGNRPHAVMLAFSDPTTSMPSNLRLGQDIHDVFYQAFILLQRSFTVKIKSNKHRRMTMCLLKTTVGIDVELTMKEESEQGQLKEWELYLLDEKGIVDLPHALRESRGRSVGYFVYVVYQEEVVYRLGIKVVEKNRTFPIGTEINAGHFVELSWPE